MQWVCEIQQRTNMRTHQVYGGIPLEKITGETEYISDYLDFEFYDKSGFMKMLDQASEYQVVGQVSIIVLMELCIIGS